MNSCAICGVEIINNGPCTNEGCLLNNGYKITPCQCGGYCTEWCTSTLVKDIDQESDLLHWAREQRTPEALLVLADWHEEDGQVYLSEELRFLSSLLRLLSRVKEETSVPSWLNGPQNLSVTQPVGHDAFLIGRMSNCLLQVTFEVDGIGYVILNQEISYMWSPWDVIGAYHQRHTPTEYMPLF